MAFLPERNYIQETLALNYSLGSGTNSFTSSDISKFTIISFQINTSSITGVNRFKLEQSSDNSKWVPLKDIIYELDLGAGSLVIEKSFFSGSYVRLRLTDTSSGTITVLLTCKR